MFLPISKQEKKLVKWLLSAAASDDAHPELQCIHKRKDGKLETSDGYRIHQCRLDGALAELEPGLYDFTIRGNVVEVIRREVYIFPSTDYFMSIEKTNVLLSLFNAEYLSDAMMIFDYVKIETSKDCMFVTALSLDGNADPHKRIAIIMRMREIK